MSPHVPPPRVAAPRPVGGARRVVGWLLVGGLVGLLVAVVLPTGLAAWSMSAWFTSQDAGRFDQVEARLAGGRESYAAASDRVRALASQDEGTSRVALTTTLTCRTVGGLETCADSTAADAELMSSARAEVAIWQARDGDRVYYRFFGEDAPTVWLMDGPPAEDARAFARERGFRSVRVVDDRWAVLGPITDHARLVAQWEG